MRTTRRPVAFLVSGSVGMMLGASALATELTVTISGVKSAEGNIEVALYDKASEFPQGVRIAGAIVAAAKGAVTVVFSKVSPGRYALSAFHDINANGRLDANMLGIPTEPYGASRDAVGRFGPPKFEDAAFDVGTEPVHLTVNLK